MAQVPASLLVYMEGLRQHDIEMIGSTFSQDIHFVTPIRRMDKRQTLAFLMALYAGFPDWHYDNDPVMLQPDGSWGVKWRQGGTHTHTLAFPGLSPVAATHRIVTIPEHFFYYRIDGDVLTEIRPDPVPGGAPRGIFEQIGVEMSPL